MIGTVLRWILSIFNAVPSSDLCKIFRDKDEQGNDVGGFYLDYSSQHFKHFQLPDWISPEDVTRLNLEKTKLKAIPPTIFEMTNLKELDLRHNRLTSVPPEIRNLSKLRVLKLAMNSLKTLPEAIGEMESLEDLHLGSNGLTRLPKKFCNLKLKVLYINDNCFAHLPPQIIKIKTIEEVYAHGNKITTVPKEIGELSDMTSFFIHRNKLASLPDTIVTLLESKLTDFQYHSKENRFQAFPPGFHQAVSKINDTSDTHCKQTKHKSLGVREKQANRHTKSKKSASTTVAAKVKEDNAVDAKATVEQAVASVTASSLLAASEKGKLKAAKCGDQLHSRAATRDIGAINIFNGPTTVYHVYPNVGNKDCQSTDTNTTAVSCKGKSTMDTKDPLNATTINNKLITELILHTAENGSPFWKDIARKLGLKESEIEQIEGENQKLKERCIKALELWRRKGGKDATVEVLKMALIDAGRKDIVDEFDAANCGGQDVATGDSGQVEEETSIMEAAGCNGNVESDDRRHGLREATTDQVQDPQAETQPKNVTSTLPKQPIGEESRYVCPNSNTSHQEKRAQKDEPRSPTSTNPEPTSIESQSRRRSTWYNRQYKKRRAELNQTPTEGGRRHQSRPGPNSSTGHETGASNNHPFRFPFKKTNQGPKSQ